LRKREGRKLKHGEKPITKNVHTVLWRKTYNEERPHSSLNDLTLYECLKEQNILLQDEKLNLNMARTMG
jgi:hypothetical protein